MHALLDLLHQLRDVQTLTTVAGTAGLVIIIFAETGLLLGFFLPGDSLLVTAGLLDTRPGIGTVVAELPEGRKIERTQLLGYEIEQLAVEAKKLGIPLDEIVTSISEHWKKLSGRETSGPEAERGGRGKR